MRLAPLLAVVALGGGEPRAQAVAPVPTAGHERLAPIVGTWTLKGQEARFRETCAWYDGRFHVVCHSESKRADGSIGRGMSILGYIAGEDAYTYHGIGARGRNVTQRGRFRDGVLEYMLPGAAGSPAMRIRLGPFDGGREFAIVEEAQLPDGTWKPRSEGRYVRID